MQKHYPEYKTLNLSQIGKDILQFWADERIFYKSISTREGASPFVFYEGPPSANGMPGIHHVMARAQKDIFCRYQTLKGKQVKRKAGWDTHGLPIELAVEKTLGITKEDIGKKITVEEYNLACRKEVMKYTDKWQQLTNVMGYWVDIQSPYITYENEYIETVWWLLKELYNKNLLYKGYTIQPYSPAAGTGLSSHELNQPGTYKNVKDATAVAMFKVDKNKFTSTNGKSIWTNVDINKEDIYFLAWTTTPWTLPSNTALCVNPKIEYIIVKTYNPYTHKLINIVLAKALLRKYFPEQNAELKIEDYKSGDKNIPYKVVDEFSGTFLEGVAYEQLLEFSKPTNGSQAFNIVWDDFVTTEDGTGIVHIAPSFGADDFRVAKQNGIGSLTLVDKRGKFLPEVNDGIFLYGDEFVKEDYLNETEKKAEFEKQKTILERNGKIKELKEYLSVDKRIVLKLQEEGKLFKKETYEHSYPHCWRTDKPVLYYPLDSWFVKVTAVKERMVELNKTINWKPEATGTGRFGNWLENANDWNLSRSRFWGIPLPIWRTEDSAEEKCIGSAEELKTEIDKSVAVGFMKKNPLAAYKANDFSKQNYSSFDLHKPYADDIILVSASGKAMKRESDLIDVWFDSGAMPYAQVHYPFNTSSKPVFKTSFPADFIAEGVDQTRGWFYTLHAIATMCFDSVAYKNVISNGLVLDKNGNKMSKRLGNAVDPFETIEKYGPDATRWYMITNAQPWDNLKFDVDGIAEVQRKFFGTLYNTYSFFAIYANIDGFKINEQDVIPIKNRTELDQWIISKLNSLIKTVTLSLDDYEPTQAARAIEEFVDEHLSNWYVRLSRRRFWKGEMSTDKKAAYETLYECLMVVNQLASPFAPFFTDWMYKNLSDCIRAEAEKNNTPLRYQSVHLTHITKAEEQVIDLNLEERMGIAQKICSMIFSIRKKENIRVRQPLQRIQIPILDHKFAAKIDAVKDLILAEVNVKQIDFVDETKTKIVKNLKLNFKTLGKKLGKDMKTVQAYAADNGAAIISAIEQEGKYKLNMSGNEYVLETEDVEIIPVDIPGWKVANNGALTVALDVSLSAELIEEGIARELVNRIQNLRKDSNFDVTDKIEIKLKSSTEIDAAVSNNLNYICSETLASSLELVHSINETEAQKIELTENINTLISISKLN
jgi:isoleucyl-tRNA synthetase